MKKIFYTLFILLFVVACSKSKEEQALDSVFFKDVPSVFTVQAAQEVRFTTAKIMGNIKNNGTSQKEDFGFCYSTSPNPTVNSTNSTKIQPSVAVFRFKEDNLMQTTLNNLQPNTRYYLRGYITSNGKTTYSNEISFQTLLPFRVTTSDLQVSSPRNVSAKGTVLGIGNGSTVVTYGVVIGNTQNPTTQSNLFISQQTGQNLTRDFSFSSTFPNVLQPNTAYHLRAFAADASGYVAYGENLSFTTPQETRVISLSGDLNFGNVNLNQTSPQRILTINNTGNTDLIINSLTFSIAGFSGNFSGTIPPNRSQSVAITFTPTQVTTYNGTITVNGNQTSGVNVINISGTGILPVVLPAVQTVSSANVTQNSATLNGNILNFGNASFVVIGFVYSSSNTNPILTNSTTTLSQTTSSTGTFNTNLTGLTPNTTYYFRAYTTNSAGTAYGEAIPFRTQSNVVEPTVQTISNSINQNNFTLIGKLNSLGTFSSVFAAFLVSTSSNPQTTNAIQFNVGNINNLNNFSTTTINLVPNTLYYYRAIIDNPATQNRILGNVLSFTTPAAPFIAPQVETVSAVQVPNQASVFDFTGNLLSLGSASTLNIGFEWSTDGGANFTSAGVGTRTTTGVFTGRINGFQNNQTYVYRAYATYIENNQTKKVVGATRNLR